MQPSPDCNENPFCKKDCNGKRETAFKILSFNITGILQIMFISVL